jgi:aspartate 1-decarboxylase
MLKHFVSGKIHGICVTDKSLDYNGSATIPARLMELAGIEPFEKVQIVNKANGERWETYAIVGPPGEFRLNGAAARKGEVGDECLVIAYRLEERFTGAKVVFVDYRNEPDGTADYRPEDDHAATQA